MRAKRLFFLPSSQSTTAVLILIAAAAVTVMMSQTAAFNSIQHHHCHSVVTKTSSTNKKSSVVATFVVSSRRNNDQELGDKKSTSTTIKPLFSTLAALAIFATTLTSSSPTLLLNNNNVANAYEESDYASETVTTVVQRLKDSTGNVDATFQVLEDVAKIITEGKGVGGQLSYDGVKLNEGYVADEDTTIYNPGLSLLTESEKERLTDAIIQNRKLSLSSNKWSENNEYAFSFLKAKLDPLHMHELEGYLKILPFWGAALYLGALFVQQNARGVFPLVYGLCALGVFGPIVILVANGP